MKIVSAAAMREIDRITTEKYGIPSLELMENAGAAVADYVVQKFPEAASILVVCGKGNNGGDGMVAARLLHETGKKVSAAVIASPEDLKGDAKQMYSRLPVAPNTIKSDRDIQQMFSATPDLIIDAILGTGATLPVSGLYALAVEKINRSGVPVVSIDLPSGEAADEWIQKADSAAVTPSAIVTFTAFKPCHVFRSDDVLIVLRQIGTPDEAIVSAGELNLITPEDFSRLLLPRCPDSNKGDFGHVLVVAGSLGKAGAGAMTGMAALRAGSGLVTVATPSSTLPTIAGFAPELMTEPLPETEAGTISILALESSKKLTAGKTVLAIGPGLSRDRETAQFVRAFIERCELQTVLDADGLNAFEGHADSLHGKNRPLILTPHPGEMARITGLTVTQIQSDRISIARKIAIEHHAYVVLKGQHTIVAEPEGQIWLNKTGNPGMATGGTGDVLTGIIAGMIAQNPADISRALIAAVYLHGSAGDIARDKVGEASLVATDLLHALPEAFAKAKSSRQTDIL